jgi:hypothetical protein
MLWLDSEEASIIIFQQLICSSWRQATDTHQLIAIHVLYFETMENVHHYYYHCCCWAQ